MKNVLLVAAAALSMLSACGVDAALDCHAICQRYSDCFDHAYDVGGCESRCRNHSGDDSAYRHSADECSACIDDRACASATFNCTAQCSAVVP